MSSMPLLWALLQCHCPRYVTCANWCCSAVRALAFFWDRRRCCLVGLCHASHECPQTPGLLPATAAVCGAGPGRDLAAQQGLEAHPWWHQGLRQSPVSYAFLQLHSCACADLRAPALLHPMLSSHCLTTAPDVACLWVFWGFSYSPYVPCVPTNNVASMINVPAAQLP